jgi:hypothetical protein
MLTEAFRDRGLPDGSVAVISAGWQEAEGDIDDIRALVPRPLIDLELYRRAESLFAGDPALLKAYRERQDRLVELQRLYRLRLRQALVAARQVRRSRAPADLVAAEVRHAISQLRALDRHHLKRTQALFGEFEHVSAASESVAESRDAVAKAIADCETVIITGGHVLVLLNRLELFGLSPLLQSRHIVAWSAGAMVLSERVVLFHDETPQGRRDPELLGAGLGLIPGYVFLPDARRRLRQKDAVRIGVFNRRFSPARCVTLNSGALLHLDDGGIREASQVGYLAGSGTIRKLRPV